MQKALGRIYDPKTMTYSFADGSSTLTVEKVEEMKAILNLMPTIAGVLIAATVKDHYLEKMAEINSDHPN